jgi:hypothetical protein
MLAFWHAMLCVWMVCSLCQAWVTLGQPWSLRCCQQPKGWLPCSAHVCTRSHGAGRCVAAVHQWSLASSCTGAMLRSTWHGLGLCRPPHAGHHSRGSRTEGFWLLQQCCASSVALGLSVHRVAAQTDIIMVMLLGHTLPTVRRRVCYACKFKAVLSTPAIMHMRQNVTT